MKPPKNVREVAKFLGMTGWYQKFIKDYAVLCEPLYTLKRKKVKIVESEAAQAAFQRIKKLVTEAPVLKLPDFDNNCELFTDARAVGIGAVLTQQSKPIAFASRTLKKEERNYTIIERGNVWLLSGC
ncbi:retrovirus-related Pol polyprotein from transposon 17.6 [Trichonephila clavipes]|uniref:RNA-directed DNA polymerase n=1 Tax=Trichonephila clavipes TaxID=2585209 RepID=A0A8X6WHV9_TRICX|nr:retrovirus-related Pol polyprotein from transposon 17.6 [Trichonephila clavipes]